MVKNLFMEFLKEEEGAGMVEYLILIAIVAVIAALLMPSLRSNMMDWFNTMLTDVKCGIGDGGTGTGGSGAASGSGNVSC